MANPERGLYDSDEDLQAYLARILMPPQSQRFNTQYELAPGLQARLGAEVQPSGGGMPQSIIPTAGLTMGPLSLNGGLQFQQDQVTPTFGAGLKLPIGGGEAEAKFNYTPNQLKLLEAEWKKKIFGGTGDLSLYGNYSQPAGDVPPGWGVGLRGRIPL